MALLSLVKVFISYPLNIWPVLVEAETRMARWLSAGEEADENQDADDVDQTRPLLDEQITTGGATSGMKNK
ncbi:unnamed protein product, partial [Amoebophrya sp. A120]|eukprot:GSA120T00002814001.1